MKAVLLLALCAALVLADPPIPNTPTQFQANIKITTEGFFPTTVSGVYYYDYPNQRERIDQSAFGDTSTQLNLYQSMSTYTWDVMAKKCQCGDLEDPMSPANVPYGSTYEGTGTVGTTSVTMWALQDPVMSAVGMYITFYVDANDYVVRINTTTANFFQTITILMDLSNYVVGPLADSVFTPATYCSCPAPPPTPTPGSCPSSPGPMCQCASSSSLSFCTDVDYPILSTLDIASTDSFVSSAYSIGIMAFPNPSSTCQANFKAFLCAFYFPVCAGSSIGITFLPCDGICPFCGCGFALAGNCTSAPSGDTCTQYGPNYCT